MKKLFQSILASLRRNSGYYDALAGESIGASDMKYPAYIEGYKQGIEARREAQRLTQELNQ